jgi:hypothetical protein
MLISLILSNQEKQFKEWFLTDPLLDERFNKHPANFTMIRKWKKDV